MGRLSLHLRHLTKLETAHTANSGNARALSRVHIFDYNRMHTALGLLQRARRLHSNHYTEHRQRHHRIDSTDNHCAKVAAPHFSAHSAKDGLELDVSVTHSVTFSVAIRMAQCTAITRILTRRGASDDAAQTGNIIFSVLITLSDNVLP